MGHGMIEYPYSICAISKRLLRLEFIDFPMIHLFGRDEMDVHLTGKWILNAVVSIRIRDNMEIPYPSPGTDRIPLEDDVAFRLSLYRQIIEEGYTREQLSEEMGLERNAVTNILGGEVEGFYCNYLEATACLGLSDPQGESLSRIFAPRPRGADDSNLALLAV